MNHMRLDPRSQRASQNPIICDIESARLERALGFGADRVINSRETNLETAVKREHNGLGPSVVIDGAGVPSLLDLACRIACPAGLSIRESPWLFGFIGAFGLFIATVVIAHGNGAGPTAHAILWRAVSDCFD
jgi:hypothetical protein